MISQRRGDMPHFKKLFKHAILVLVCSSFTHCFETSFQKFDNEIETLRLISANVILARYESFSTLSQDLSDQIDALCESPSEISLTKAQEAWWAVRGPWKRSEIINFGPIREYPLRLGPKIDKWPVNEQAVEDLIDEREVTTQERFSALGGATRGLPVIEYLLWYERPNESIFDRLSQDVRRCEVLKFAGKDIANSARQLALAWREEGWLELTESSDSFDAPFDDEDAVISELVNRMAFTVENIRVDKFEKPLGDLTPGNALPDIIESRFSKRSIEDARDALKGIAEVWHGTGADESRDGLKYIVTSLRVVDTISEALEDATFKLTALEDELTELPLTHPDELRAAIESLTTLQRLIQADLSQATRATIRFNDTDGD